LPMNIEIPINNTRINKNILYLLLLIIVWAH